MRRNMRGLFWGAVFFVGLSQAMPETSLRSGRERLLMDFGWRFALGHAWDAKRDFDHGTSYFSYVAKAGYGDGPAAEHFDDRAWRVVDLPHDWAVEVPFHPDASHSHGYKAVGRAFPEYSMGWYRKRFFIPESDLGRRVVIAFDGVHRNASFWINGFYLGTEHSGYSSFQFDVTDYLNYGAENVIAVRVDVTMEEGWYYEGAGIYRHVWLIKTHPLHVAPYGTFVTTEIHPQAAEVTAQVTIVNESVTDAVFDIHHAILDPSGKEVTTALLKSLALRSAAKETFSCRMIVHDPKLWSLESPHLYKLVTSLRSGDEVVDTYETPFGIRSIRFDPNAGFFLNGIRVPIRGTNNHQDHAGVGTAIPDALQAFRVARLKALGCNAYRTSHNPPTPELLDICDRMGMLVLVENRLMGSSPEQLIQLERMILRDRNHPSVIAWSIGNEEWAIEGNIKGERIAATMQALVKRLDPTRRVTVASSGGWGEGVSKVIDVMGFNYLVHGDIDAHHAQFPWQPGWGTEETTGSGTRGVYEDDRERGRMAQMDRYGGVSIERGMQFYAARPFLAGLFFWTGFDYRGEPNPLVWPAVCSEFGVLDLCGFPKDNAYYLQSVWTNEPVLHIFPHWNWQGREGEKISVWAYSNCESVELFLNGRSLGRQEVDRLSHLAWEVPYDPGILLAHGYIGKKKVISKKVETAGEPALIRLIPDRLTIDANGEDVSVITICVEDAQGRLVPTACNEITFHLDGPGRIIGVGNGDPASHEPDRYFETIQIIPIVHLKECPVEALSDRPEVDPHFDDASWRPAFSAESKDWRVYTDSLLVIRGVFDLPVLPPDAEVNLFTKSIVEDQSIFVNGHRIATHVKRDDPNQSFRLDHAILHPGQNVYAVTGKRFKKRHPWDEPNRDPGRLQVIIPPEPWKRRVFQGLAQLIVQSKKEAGVMVLTAESPGLKPARVKIATRRVPIRPAVP